MQVAATQSIRQILRTQLKQLKPKNCSNTHHNKQSYRELYEEHENNTAAKKKANTTENKYNV